MKVLMINKFLYPNGGSETYIFELGKQLEKMGHEVAGVALDGAEAVERICEVRPDMVLLDLNMPEKDGIAVIREAYLDRMIPAIIITGHYSELLMNRADIPCVYG